MRFPKKMFKKIIKENSGKRINLLDLENKNGIYSYSDVKKKKFENIIYKKLRKHIKNVPIYNCQT